MAEVVVVTCSLFSAANFPNGGFMFWKILSSGVQSKVHTKAKQAYKKEKTLSFFLVNNIMGYHYMGARAQHNIMYMMNIFWERERWDGEYSEVLDRLHTTSQLARFDFLLLLLLLRIVLIISAVETI